MGIYTNYNYRRFYIKNGQGYIPEANVNASLSSVTEYRGNKTALGPAFMPGFRAGETGGDIGGTLSTRRKRRA